MIGRKALARGGAAVGAAMTALVLAGCGAEVPPPPSDPVPTPSAAVTPGQARVEEPGVFLRVTGAVLHVDPAGDGSLAMRVTVGSGAPEHLGMVATVDGDQAVLRGGTAVDGSMTSAGVLVQPDSTVAFGTRHGPAVVLHGLRLTGTQRTLPLMLQFGVAGLVRVDVRVTRGA